MPEPEIPSPAIDEQQSVITNLKEQVKDLSAEVKSVRAFQDGIIRTAQWAMTTVFALGALLVGYQWYDNHWASEREKAALIQELKTGVSEKIKEDFSAFTNTADSKFQAFRDRLLSDVQSRIDRELATVNRELLTMKFDIIGQPENIERTPVKVALDRVALALKDKTGFWVKYELAGLEGALAITRELSRYDRSRIDELTSQAGTENAVSAQRIRDLSKKLPEKAEPLLIDVNKLKRVLDEDTKKR